MGKKPRKKRMDIIPNAVTDDRRARIWTLREEGRSFLEIAKTIRCSYTTISDVLGTDPSRLEAIIAIHREQRARAWEHVERDSLRVLSRMIDRAERQFFAGAKDRPGTAAKYMEHGPAWARVIRQAGADAAHRANLLGGQPTERVAHEGTTAADPAAMDADSMIDRAIRIGRVDLLPAVLAAEAERRIKDAATRPG